MNRLETLLVWALFLGSSVFGHVALKRAAGHGDKFDYLRAFTLWKDPWALGALFAWGASCLLWALLRTRHGVGQAAGTSSLCYVLMLGAAAVWLGETLDWRQGVGCVLIGAGIWLTHK